MKYTHQDTKEETNDGSAKQDSGDDGNDPVDCDGDCSPCEPACQPRLTLLLHKLNGVTYMNKPAGRRQAPIMTPIKRSSGARYPPAALSFLA